MASINYDDKRFTEVETEKQQALTENEKLYGGMIEQSDSFYQEQIDASKEWAEQQKEIQQEQTDFAIEQIEQQKQQAHKDYTREQSGAYVDYQKQSNQYGAAAEQLAAGGMTNTGFSESSKVSMWNTYQNRMATARESYNRAVLNYENAMKEARLQNSSALAEIAFNALQKELELALQGFQYKNQLLTEQANKKLEIDSMYYGRYQDVVNQINTENALAEQIRQYNEQMAYQKAKDEREYQLQQQQLAEQRRQSNASLALQREKWEYEKAQAEKQKKEEQLKKNSTTASLIPLSTSYAQQIAMQLGNYKTDKQKLSYLQGLYNKGKISQSNLNYFLDLIGM